MLKLNKMAILRTFLRPAARLAGMRAAGQARSFLAAHQRTADVQNALLRRLLASAADSDFGREHNFDRIGSYRDFTAAVPIGDYETHRRYVNQVMDGRAEAMFAPGTRILMFAVTSGTTGAPKYIPITRRFISDYRRGWNIFGIRMLMDHPGGWLREIVTIGSSARESHTPAGVPCGSISGFLAENQKWIVRRMYPAPPQVNDIRDPHLKYYAILRASITRDVGIVITPNPSTAIKLALTARDNAEQLIRDVRDGTISLPDEPAATKALAGLSFRPDPAAAARLEGIVSRHGELLPRYFWNLNFLSLWTGGTVGLYLPRVRRFYGDAPIRDMGLLASEGRLSIPMRDDTASGVAEITSNFLEFIPADQIESANPDVLGAHQVEPGSEYFILFSNWAGLWRYNIDDRVRVTGRLGDSPVFEFLSKGLHACSITGEKITEHQVVQAMALAAGQSGANVEAFVLQGHFADQPYYELRIEPVSGVNAESLASGLDKALRRLNVEYDAKRSGGRLGPVRLRLARPGDFAAQETRRIEQRQGRAEQYKHKYLMTDVVNDESRTTA